MSYKKYVDKKTWKPAIRFTEENNIIFNRGLIEKFELDLDQLQSAVLYVNDENEVTTKIGIKLNEYDEEGSYILLRDIFTGELEFQIGTFLDDNNIANIKYQWVNIYNFIYEKEMFIVELFKKGKIKESE